MGIICSLLQVYSFVIFIRIIMSWIPPTPGTTYAQIYEFFYTVTEPVLAPIRRALPPMRMGMAALDLSPIVVVIGIQLLIGVLC